MGFQAGEQRPVPRPASATPETLAYLRDYAALLEAVSFPSFVLDRAWGVVLANEAFRALFRDMGPHPSAMPDENFLRFVLFHPDAASVLGEHESRWCLPMLAQFASALERDGGHEDVLRDIRQEIAQDPIMDVAYRHGLPHWVRAVGEQAVEHDGAVRPLLHPDPRWGATECRFVVETPGRLERLGFTRSTMVLREAPRRSHRPRRRRRPTGHLRAVPAATD
ncbi:hypothetical protein AAH978_04430 [Streptomyces sp. ZYX-F-203]